MGYLTYLKLFALLLKEKSRGGVVSVCRKKGLKILLFRKRKLPLCRAKGRGISEGS